LGGGKEVTFRKLPTRFGALPAPTATLPEEEAVPTRSVGPPGEIWFASGPISPGATSPILAFVPGCENMGAMSAVTVITGGTVVDGTGTPGRRTDVAFADGTIIAVGDDLASTYPDPELVDAVGKVIAPGFIDIHTHFDAQVFWDSALTPSCFHGVSTVVAGNCGFSIAPTHPRDRELIANPLEKVEDMDPASLNAGIPWEFETFPEYLDTVERRGAVLNYAAYIGHNSGST
jgi:hypothetical protein